jgi:RNA polymerase sigma-70 factor (ECF subfamily)
MSNNLEVYSANNPNTERILTDENLIIKFQNGDVQAFDILVKRYKDRLLNFVYRFVGNRADAEDIIQETFIKVYKNKHLYNPTAKFITWLFTIASNVAKSELRKRRIRNAFSISNFIGGKKDQDIIYKGEDPETLADSVVKEEYIHKAISKLPKEFREVIILRDIQEFSYEEISEILKVPIGTVKSRVNRGRERLQKLLKPIIDKK